MGSSENGPVARLTKVDVVRCSGPDSSTFLQGQLSQDVAGIEVGSAAWSLLLQPQGKVIAWLRVHRVDSDEWLLEVDAGWGEAVVTRLARFRLRVDCSLGAVESWQCLQIRGSDALEVATPPDVRRVPSIWPGEPGIDLVGPTVEVPRNLAVDADEVERRRILAGVPMMGAELDDSVIPAEAGPWLVELSASFDKGCYVGQELVARVESRGSNTPRRLRGVRANTPLAVGDPLNDGDGKAVGLVTSTQRVADGVIGLAYVARSVEVPGSVGGVDVFAVPVSS